ncbi:MAG: hypothetical protein Q7R69_02555 [bacterium]|nr:hypothetical protein [bacterium]
MLESGRVAFPPNVVELPPHHDYSFFRGAPDQTGDARIAWRSSLRVPERNHFLLELLLVRRRVDEPTFDPLVLEGIALLDEACLREMFPEVVAPDPSVHLLLLVVEVEINLVHLFSP